ncbi:hypothetical protein MY11210_009204 [Beauveria gryllotalpidicola]
MKTRFKGLTRSVPNERAAVRQAAKDANSSELLKAVFHTTHQQARDIIAAHLTQIADEWSECKPGVAGVTKLWSNGRGGTNPITLCDIKEADDSCGGQYLGDVLLHGMSHSWGRTNDKCHGMPAIQQITSASSLNNADSYTRYAKGADLKCSFEAMMTPGMGGGSPGPGTSPGDDISPGGGVYPGGGISPGGGVYPGDGALPGTGPTPPGTAIPPGPGTSPEEDCPPGSTGPQIPSEPGTPSGTGSPPGAGDPPVGSPTHWPGPGTSPGQDGNTGPVYPGEQDDQDDMTGPFYPDQNSQNGQGDFPGLDGVLGP